MLRSVTKIKVNSSGFNSNRNFSQNSRNFGKNPNGYRHSHTEVKNFGSDASKSSIENVRSEEPFVNLSRDLVDIIKKRMNEGHDFEKNLSRRDFIKFHRVKSSFPHLALANPLTNPILSSLRNTFPSLFPDSFLTPQLLESRRNSLSALRKEKAEKVKEMIKKGLEEKGKSDLFQFISPAKNGQASFLDNVPKEKVQHVEGLFVNDVNGMDEETLSTLSEGLGIRMANRLPLVYLRYRLGEKLDQLDMDDRRIKQEGLSSFTEEELREALVDRGYLSTQGMNREQCEKALQEWSKMASSRSPDALLLYSMLFRDSN